MIVTYDDATLKRLKYKNKRFIFDDPIKITVSYIYHYIVSFFWDVLYKLLLTLHPLNDESNKYFVSVCSIFKNEAPFLQEWIEYHILIGVDHFYLYNNNSEDNFREILAPYISSGYVTLIDWPDNPGQLSSYKHWYLNFRHETKWVSFLDLDEFVCIRYNDSIKTWLNKFSKYPVVLSYWKMFGTSGKLDHDYNALVIEQYFNSWEKPVNIGKLFYNTKFDIESMHLGMMHSFNVNYKGFSIPPVNQYEKFVKYGIHRGNSNDIAIQINHYWSKSFNSYIAKHKRGDAAFGESPRNFEYFKWHELHNNSIDLSIFRFISILKKQIRERGSNENET